MKDADNPFQVWLVTSGGPQNLSQSYNADEFRGGDERIRLVVMGITKWGTFFGSHPAVTVTLFSRSMLRLSTYTSRRHSGRLATPLFEY